jgi:hypothetical protein
VNDNAVPVQAVIKPLAPENEMRAVVVVYENGDTCSYTIDGRYRTDDCQRFIFKPKKVKRLKPLHVVLAEDGEYEARGDGWIYMRYSRTGILPGMFPYFGTTNMPSQYSWDEKWIEEVEE